MAFSKSAIFALIFSVGTFLRSLLILFVMDSVEALTWVRVFCWLSLAMIASSSDADLMYWTASFFFLMAFDAYVLAISFCPASRAALAFRWWAFSSCSHFFA